MKNSKLLLVACLFCGVLVASGASASGLNFELGGGIGATVIRFSDRNDQRDGNVAVIASKTTLTPYLALSGDEYYPLENYDIGVSWQFWGSTYKVHRQKVNKKYKDIDTEIQGEYFYALPIFYYRWGDKLEEHNRGYRVSLGLGFGASYATAEGEVILTEVEGQPIEKINDKQWNYSAGVFFRAEYRKFFFQVATYSPQIASGDYIYRISRVGWVLGYKFSLDFDI